MTSRPATKTSRLATALTTRDRTLRRPKARKAGWTDLDVRAVDTIRVLAADAVQRTGNGHPGTAMSLAPAAYLLFQQVMTHDPADPHWLGRDRFVLSCGHSSLTLYLQLFLSGYGLELSDLQSLRTWGSLTPGHPEVRHTKGVEITTGPLGSGSSSTGSRPIWRWPRSPSTSASTRWCSSDAPPRTSSGAGRPGACRCSSAGPP